MGNLIKAGLVIYRAGWVGNKRPCVNCGTCGKNAKIIKEAEIVPLLIPGFFGILYGFSREGNGTTVKPIMPPTGITFKT